MFKIDRAILEADQVICKNIDRFDNSERGLLSQNILAQLRNYVEYIVQKIHSNGVDIDPNNYSKKKEAWEHIQKYGQYRFLAKFHSLLQKSVSHYTFDEGGSERLMLKYYEYLIRIKVFLKDTYNLDVLINIDEFPLDLDTDLVEYYKKISSRINRPSPHATRNPFNERYYIQKIKPFFIDHCIYYEVTFTVANDKSSKFDRVIAFTNIELLDNYAVKLSLHNDYIEVMGKTMPIQVIDSWEVSIRPCEVNRFADIFGRHPEISSSNYEFRDLMKFLTNTRMSLVNIVSSSDSYYMWAKNICTKESKVTYIFDVLDQSREIIKNNKPGSNVVRYFLHKMNNKTMKMQYYYKNCSGMSNLYLKWGCMPFDQMPLATSLIKHNPRIHDLFDCINTNDREHEFLARKIKNNTEHQDVLFSSKSELSQFEDIGATIGKFNSLLYTKKKEHMDRTILMYKDHFYIKGYADDTAQIISRLKELSNSGIAGYSNFVESWLAQNQSYKIDSKEKLSTLKTMFSNSQVALIYGSAGTGKSTLINHISNLYNDREKLFLANTNPAVDNMRRKVKSARCEFKTIAKFLTYRNIDVEYDILVIDECSTVSNKDMRTILDKAKFKLLVLVGDVFQIEAILFGNWFSIARTFIPKSSVSELTKPYRSSKEELLTVWDRVRNLDDAILEPLVKSKYSVKLDESIFEHFSEDEIILCLNYDGLYGINNINKFLQSSNPNKAVGWGINIYKVGDPILFNESERFTPLIYNNMKGRIIDIESTEHKIRFDIEIDIAITEWDSEDYDFILIEESERKNSIISFWVNRFKSTDEDDDSSDAIVPFQVAYAVSIHKAQGLEYKSVKVVITNEVEELITHNIFYTAITRAKEDLKIYWSPETEKKILEGLSLNNYRKDAALLSELFSLQ
ncbi:ATP-dependent DNA helicase [Acidaminobacter hydrogenoformans]|uniref:UvrD-like helicase C-terminal domain-containing protein n=1 Tax=Acidaminobacter hydrogenoformans DSM 2784 TaxID=1120920 RepID=A0A1G5S2U3_9FIRM|nr:ATP-dependent RecD-like DNA helicase [Acidaminobacter hydrogenoformans]SCZ80488.1 UvrD-like helicase C-terminal domain-containing protein [Acidaminobacter hydrogenoformans DSM 2784]